MHFPAAPDRQDTGDSRVGVGRGFRTCCPLEQKLHVGIADKSKENFKFRWEN